MKKIILSLTVAAATLFAAEVSAQIKNDKGTFEKPVAGNLIMEIQLTPNISGGNNFKLNDPLIGTISAGLSYTAIQTGTGNAQSFNDLATIAPSLKGRYFLSDDLALRVQLGVLSSSATTKVEPTTGPSTEQKISRSGFNLALGIEKHFSGAERLSTYGGADLVFGLVSAKAKSNNGTAEFSGKQKGTSFGLRVVTGFDYYFIPKVYLGAELGLGLSATSYGLVKRSGTGLVDGTDKSKSFSILPFATPSLRLGFIF
jgi:Putative OmpA-OmpF-like porin family